jgi:DNA-binding IscR family transcriptional regulator
VRGTRLPAMVEASRDAAVLVAIVRHQVTHSRPCLYPDIEQATGLSRSVVKCTLERLRRAGLVTWDDGHVGTLRSTCAIVVRS